MIADKQGFELQIIDGAYSKTFEDGTWLLEDEAIKELDFLNKGSKGYYLKKVDNEIVFRVVSNYTKGYQKLGEDEDVFPERTMRPLIEKMKQYKEDRIKFEELFWHEKEENKMSEKKEDIAVRFYEGYVSKEIINFKNKDGSKIKLARVKMPNDPGDERVRRSFLVKESAIGTDIKNQHMRYVYLPKDVEFKVVRRNFDPETKKSEILTEEKMTGQQIADVFDKERDRQYAQWKANQPQPEQEIDNPELEEVEDYNL